MKLLLVCFEGIARLSRRVWRRFVRGSREISLVPSLHRASTDALIHCFLMPVFEESAIASHVEVLTTILTVVLYIVVTPIRVLRTGFSTDSINPPLGSAICCYPVHLLLGP